MALIMKKSTKKFLIRSAIRPASNLNMFTYTNQQSARFPALSWKMALSFSVLCLIGLILLVSCSSDETMSSKDKAEVYFNQGTDFLMRKDYTSALEHLLKAEELDSSNSKIQTNLGMTYYFKKRNDQALYHLQKAVKLDSKNSDAKSDIASIYYYMKKYDLSEKEYLAVLEDLTYKGQFRAYYGLGLIKVKQGDFESAKKYFQNSVNENHNYCPAYFSLGELFFHEGQFELAYQNFHSASKGTCYEEPAPQFYQGLTLLKMNKLGQAKTKLEEIVNRFPESEYASLAKEHLKSPKLAFVVSSPEINNGHTSRSNNPLKNPMIKKIGGQVTPLNNNPENNVSYNLEKFSNGQNNIDSQNDISNNDRNKYFPINDKRVKEKSDQITNQQFQVPEF